MSLPAILQQFAPQDPPAVRVGDLVVVHQKILEGGKERLQAFEGRVIRVRKRKSLDGNFTVRKESFGVGVEKTYPLFSPQIAKVEFKKGARVKRARLYYLRDRRGKERLKETKAKRLS